MKRLRIHVEGKAYDVEVELLDEDSTASAPRASAPRTSTRSVTPASPAPSPAPAAPAPSAGGAGNVTSPLAAVVVSIDVAVGDTVTEGQNVVTLEAMKMNTMVTSPQAGTVKAVLVKPGDAVEEGQAILAVE